MSEGQETRRLNGPRETGWKDRECQPGGTPGARLVSVGMRNTAQGQLWTQSPSPPELLRRTGCVWQRLCVQGCCCVSEPVGLCLSLGSGMDRVCVHVCGHLGSWIRSISS